MFINETPHILSVCVLVYHIITHITKYIYKENNVFLQDIRCIAMIEREL